MAATTQTDINTLQTTINADGTLKDAQKAKAQTLLYSLSRVLFENASAHPYKGFAGSNPQS